MVEKQFLPYHSIFLYEESTLLPKPWASTARVLGM